MDKNLLKIEEKNLIIRKKFNSAKLMVDFPPKIFSNNKKVIFKVSCPSGCVHRGELTFSRWTQIDWPEGKISSSNNFTQHIMEENTYQYQPSQFARLNSVEWHINFADLRLFGYYGGGLFAQDEMQVAEHPILGSLKECISSLELQDSRFGPYTRDVYRSPTPILIRGVERRVRVSVEPNAAEGRPNGLYGKNFSKVDEVCIRNACKVISPPTITNLIAIEAPKYGKGNYSLKQITTIFNTAHTAFLAAKIESFYQIENVPHVIIHTGNWGTGAYGGNKALMALLQIFAARVAGIDYLVYHTFDSISSEKYQEALSILDKEIIPTDQNMDIINILSKIEKMKFDWGFSDGN